jgi:putative drug exporter of the RND superfamily
LSKLLRLLTGRASRWVVLLGILLAVGLLGTVERAETPGGRLDAAPVGADSTEGTRLQAELPEGEDNVAVVLATSEDDERLTPQQVRGVTEVVRGLPQDVQPIGPPVAPSDDGTATISAVAVPQLGNAENGDFIADLRDTLDETAPDGVGMQVTGPAAVQADLANVFDGASLRLLLVTASVVAALLVITYRSPVLWLVPVIVIGLADQLAATLAPKVLQWFDIPWDGSTTGILSVLVFGAGTNYALLLISRYRDELRLHPDRHDAMAAALRPAAAAVIPSAFTVFLGLVCLLLSVVPTTRGLGLACAVGIIIGATFVLAVLPGTLVLLGRWIFWPQVPRTSMGPVDRSRSVFARVGRRVAARPLLFAGGLVAALLVGCLGVLRIDTGLGESDQFLETPESIAASERAAESYPAGTVDPVQVVTRADPQEVARSATAVPEVASARLSSSGNGVSQVAVVLTTTEREDSERAVERLREALASYDDTHVTGTVPSALDSEAASQRDQRVIIPLILVLVMIGLVLLLRSVVAPVLLVASVVLTYGAALGIAWVAYTQVFGFGAMDSAVPLFAFLFLVALGVDYNIFLVTRAAEEAPEHGTRDGMLRALASTGGVITSAGVLLAAVFASLGVLPLVVLAQLGIVIFIGVLLDTLLVRTILVPALAQWLGDRFWWPRRLHRVPTASQARSPTVSPR